MWVQNGGFSKWVFLALIFNSVANCQNTNGNIGNIDLEKVRKAVIDPSTISNQITGTVLNEVFVNTGYIIGGKSHGIWKSQKKSHSTLRAKRATFTKVHHKMPKMVHFWQPFKSRNFDVKQCYQTNRTKIGGKRHKSNVQIRHYFEEFLPFFCSHCWKVWLFLRLFTSDLIDEITNSIMLI